MSLTWKFEVTDDSSIVIWVRHGQSRGNVLYESGKGFTPDQQHDPDLTVLGNLQALEIAKALKIKIDANKLSDGKPRPVVVHISPLKRARQTAEPFLELLGDAFRDLDLVRIDKDDRLHEYHVPFAGADKFTDTSLEAFAQRVDSWVDELSVNTALTGSIHVIFGHSLFIGMALRKAALAGAPLAAPSHFSEISLHLANGSFSETVLSIDHLDRPFWSLTKVNDHSHITPGLHSGVHVK